MGAGGAGGRSLLGFGEEPEPGQLKSICVHHENRHLPDTLIMGCFKVQCINRKFEIHPKTQKMTTIEKTVCYFFFPKEGACCTHRATWGSTRVGWEAQGAREIMGRNLYCGFWQ